MSAVILSIDPGLSGTGIAVWRKQYWGLHRCPMEIVNLYPSSKLKWPAHAAELYAQVQMFVENLEVVKVYIEFPEFFDGAFGRSVAVKGDLQKLAFWVGTLTGIFWELNIDVINYFPRDWKGQLPKRVVEERIRERLPDLVEKLNPKDHAWDSIGIGLFAQGLF